MKITIYELLGLVKDGKAPRVINFLGDTKYYDEDTKNYYNVQGNSELFNSYVGDYLNDEVEIIGEDKKIEKLFNCEMKSKNGEITILVANINDLKDKINEIIDKINKEEKW